MKKTTDTAEGASTALDRHDVMNVNQIDQYWEEVNDLGEFIDEARDYLLNGCFNTKAELIEALKLDHVRATSDPDKWATKLPLFRAAASIAFDNAITNGEILPSNKRAWPKPKPFDPNEIRFAKSTPDCIVEDYLFADIAVLPAPGGFGKTTLMLFEAACIAHGTESLYNKRILKPGPVVIITAEDGREQMAARLRDVILDNGMLGRQAKILKNVYVCDVAGMGLRLTALDKDVVVIAEAVDGLIRILSEIRPVLVIFDPAVSFGIGETRVNDSEQGLIEAARAIRNAVGCCIRFIHHTGKQNARDGAVDQYAGRGGSAFADGARMVHVLARVNPVDWFKATGTEVKPGETALRLALPKMSYTKPLPDIYIRRSGFRFDYVTAASHDEQRVEELIYRLITSDFSKGILRSIKSIEDEDTLGSITRAQRRSAVRNLIEVSKKLVRRTPPNGKGRAQYLHPIQPSPSSQKSTLCLAATPGHLEGESGPLNPEEAIRLATLLNSPPYRTGSGGELADATTPSQILDHTATFGEIRRVGDMGYPDSNFLEERA